MVRDFLDYLPPRLREYDDTMVLGNRLFEACLAVGGERSVAG